jgi:hypothetical protein
MLILVIAACGQEPFDWHVDPWHYYPDPDSAWKAIANLEYSYTSRDIDRYQECFSDEFVFGFLKQIYPESLWGSWGLETELQTAWNLFDEVYSVDLTFWGGYDSLSTQYPGVMECRRQFDLKVYTDPSGSEGYRAIGFCTFSLLQDSTGAWRISDWLDESNPAEGEHQRTWAQIKLYFLD